MSSGNMECESQHDNPQTEDLNASNGLLGTNNNDHELLISAVRVFRKVLCVTCDKPSVHGMMTRPDLIALLTDCLKVDNNSKLQFEAAWALTNIAAGKSALTETIFEAGTIPILVKLLDSRDPDVCEQSVWALANIIGSGPELRDTTVESGVVPKLLSFIHPQVQWPLLREVTRAIANLCRYSHRKPSTAPIFSSIVPMVSNLVHHPDNEVLTNVMWTFAYLARDTEEVAQMISQNDYTIRCLVNMLRRDSPSVQEAVLSVIVLVANRNSLCVQSLLDAGLLDVLPEVLSGQRYGTIKCALTLLSAVTGRNVRHNHAVMNHKLLVSFVGLHMNNPKADIAKEAMWIARNLAFVGGCSLKQLIHLFGYGMIRTLNNMNLVPLTNSEMQHSNNERHSSRKSRSASRNPIGKTD